MDPASSLHNLSLYFSLLDTGTDQWPEIESVWDTLPPSTTSAAQTTPTDHTQKGVASLNAAKLKEAEDRKREEEEARLDC